MSVKLRFASTSDGGLIHRSRSFTGFNSLTGRRLSLHSKAMAGGKSPKTHLSLRRGSGLLWSLQPEQVDRVFQALRRGLKECLEGHQAEMDFLSSQQRESKRNSRLAFLYDLEKEMRVLERFIRRLEFHISKVEELYETYCVQWRLSEGAVNMKRAFSLSPSSRASRESLLELGRNHRHSLQDMSTMEGELEVLLGELHIKMKGLIGFARLCPGDQYEVVVRLGRQRWRIRGKIDSDDTQSWDHEDMVFLPHIHHNFEIKVTEAKGLGWLLVGMVTCASADFFVATPQMMLVDVTELGTIKLQLEVTWSPFDSTDKMKPLSLSRQLVTSRKSSVQSWTAPNTPSFTEKYFISMVRQLQEQDGSLPSLQSRSHPTRGGVSLLSYLSDSSHASGGGQSYRAVSYPSSPGPSPIPGPGPSPSPSLGGSQGQLSVEGEELEEVGEECWGAVFDSPEHSHSSSPAALQRSSTPDILRKNSGGESKAEPQGAGGTAALKSSDPPVAPSNPNPSAPTPSATAPVMGRPSGSGGTQGGGQALRLGALIAKVEKGLQDQRGSDKQLRALDHQVLHLGTILKNDLSLMRTSSSEESLAVEEVLESFDFLSQDFNADDDTSCFGSLRVKDSGIGSFQQTTLRSIGLLCRDDQAPSEEELLVAPLTSGNWSLDQALETHLDLCSILLQMLRTSDFGPSRTEVLEEMSLQAEVLDLVSHLLLEKNNNISAGDVLPRAQRTKDLLLFWGECVNDGGGGSLFCCSADTFCRTLKRRFTHRVKAKQPGQSDKVFSQLVQQVQAVCRVMPQSRPICTTDRVSIFQLSVYLKRWSFQELGDHIYRLSKEEYILSTLRGPKRRRALNKLRGQSLAELLPLRATLQTLAALQVDSNHNVCRAAANCMSRAAHCAAFRSTALVYYTESLRSSDVRVQQGSCLALKCLRAAESVDFIAELWCSTDEDLRGSARETVLSFGKKGYQAFQKMDQLYTDLEEEAYQNRETEITIL
ncbi:unnamed protein product [Ophioblennius macclurei]